MTDRSVIMPLTLKAVPQEDKRRLILDAARRLLVRRGYRDFALDELAREAGVAKGTLFLYFRSKDELFEAAFADLVDALGASLDALLRSGLAGKALLRETVRTILAHFERGRDFLGAFGSGRFPGCGDRSCERLLKRMSLNITRLRRLLRRCAEDGALRPAALDFAPFALFGLCRSASLGLGARRTRPPAAKTRDVVAFFLKGAGR